MIYKSCVSVQQLANAGSILYILAYYAGVLGCVVGAAQMIADMVDQRCHTLNISKTSYESFYDPPQARFPFFEI